MSVDPFDELFHLTKVLQKVRDPYPPAPPRGTGERIPPQGFALPLRSACGLRMLFLSRHRPPGARLTAAQPSRPRIPIGLNACHSRTDLSSVPSIPVFGTPGPVLSGQVSSKTPFYAFCVATCRHFYPKWAAFGEGSPQKLRRTHLLWTPVPKVLNLYCVISGNTYLYTDKSGFCDARFQNTWIILV